MADRTWECVISYENRGEQFHTSRWRLSGVCTKTGNLNTDQGELWLVMSRTSNTVTATLYKDDGLASGNAVATGTASVASIDGTGENAAELTLTASNTSGLTGSFWIHNWIAAGTAPMQVCLAVDADLELLAANVADMEGYDLTTGAREFIRIAQEDVLAGVCRRYSEELGGHGAPEAWFITDASRQYPDLRRIANPAQLRRACSCRALALLIGRDHLRATDTAYSNLRDYWNGEFAAAMDAIVLAVKGGDGDNATASAKAGVVYQSRA